MLATPTITTAGVLRSGAVVGGRPATSDGNFPDSGAPPSSAGSVFSGFNNKQTSPLQTQKFPHTRAQLALIARDHRFREMIIGESHGNGLFSGNESDIDEDEQTKVSSDLVRRVAALLDDEREEELKELLKKTFELDDESSETPVLDLMHAHKDDISGVPFLFLTPTRRPLSRPSSRASNHSAVSFRLAPGPPRADSPNPHPTVSAPSSPSLLGPGPIRRPHTPVMSPLATSHTSSHVNPSPTSSPTFSHINAGSYFAASLPASPLSSPRLLNAKAHEFRPTRPLSAASSNPGTTSSFAGRRAETPSPDLWAHGPGSLRGASKLAIASPLIPDNTLLPPGTPPRAHTPTSPLRISSRGGDEDDSDDPFDPFSQAAKMHNNSRSFHSSGNIVNHTDYEAGSSLSDESSPWNDAYPHPSASFPDMFGEFDSIEHPTYGPHSFYPDQMQEHQQAQQQAKNEYDNMEYDPDTAATLTDGMTPFDVLSSVFGSTLAPSELEEALAVNGYDFERAMQWLVDRTRPTGSPPNAQRGGFAFGGGVHVISRGQAGMLARGGRSGFGGVPNARGVGGRFVNGNGRPVQGGNRVCRYFLAGECMRADCRFSHDLDRALCRFWLRGTCAKGESCEFLHHLPNEVDVQGISNAMSVTDINDRNGSQNMNQSQFDEFPSLGHDSVRGARRGQFGNKSSHDPSRTRFAAAVKKTPFTGAPPAGGLAAQMAGMREAKAALGDSVFSRPTVVAPRPSPRIRLRSPALLPTLPTGSVVNELYMAYRSRSLQLGAARNACLSRAADAWRRGDGAAAKRFSREGHDLNTRMGAEAAQAASKLVRERAKAAEAAVKARDASWSSDPADRTARGKACAGGLGVCLGVAGTEVSEEMGKLTYEERTEVALDLHGLHANEATEVLEEFLLALEKEHFFGLAFVVVGEEKHTGTQDTSRGASRARLATGIREWLHNWGYPWNERDGVICVDPLTHMQ